jgi:beta-galactosidase
MDWEPGPGLPLQADPGRPDYSNEHVFRRGCLPARCDFLPSKTLSLSGVWDFCYSASPQEAPAPTDDPTDGIEWQNIDVPGHWQLQGYGHPHYTNIKFPFPVYPPHVPTENPTGTYRRSFCVARSWKSSSQLRLRFDGVDSAYHVWVNGALVGYAQGSRNPSEFDITNHVRTGPDVNQVWVRVYQWSDGSYIEDQDQWWLSGMCYLTRVRKCFTCPLLMLCRHLPTRLSDWVSERLLHGRFLYPP